MNAVVSNAMADQQNAEIERTVRTERARLFNFIRKRVRHEDDAEDILQDVLWQFIEAYRRLETIERVTSWLFQVARNKIADSYRKKSPVQTVDMVEKPSRSISKTSFRIFPKVLRSWSYVTPSGLSSRPRWTTCRNRNTMSSSRTNSRG